MTDAIQRDVRCPGCNAEAPFTLYRSLNVTLNPTEKQSLVAGELFRFKCPKCGAATQVVYPMLYHDMGQKLMIWMIPEDEPGEAMGELQMPGMPDGGAMADYRGRRVDSVNELLEKILIFDAQLDDLAIEMVKILIATQLQAAGQPDDAKVHFAQVQADAGDVEQLVFAIVTPTGTRGAAIPREPMYANMVDAAKELASRHPPPGKWPRVDAAYLNRLMSLDIEEKRP
jgi:hypothetical protein